MDSLRLDAARVKSAIYKLETALEHPVGQQFATKELEEKLDDARFLLSLVEREFPHHPVRVKVGKN